MKIVIFGLSISSSWGNGHATLWRALIGALVERGHEVHFFERDVPYYARHRDLTEIPGASFHLYGRWEDAAMAARLHAGEADAAMMTSYFPDTEAAAETILASTARLKIFYDLDAPVTLKRLRAGERVDYIPACGLQEFNLVLSYAGGPALEALCEFGARRAEVLYGSVDSRLYRPQNPVEAFRSDLCYLGTYAADRQPALEALLLDPARRAPEYEFIIAGAQYPPIEWPRNVQFLRHLSPPDHPAFYCSSRATLNITRTAMAEMGYCPSGRLFEAAACGVPILSDEWAGLDEFFAPGREILIACGPEDVIEALRLPNDELKNIGTAARRRVLACHTAQVRARELERILEQAGGKDIAPVLAGAEN